MSVATYEQPVVAPVGRSKRVAIVGAGLGGLSAAIHLRLAGHDVVVFEKNARAGGRANLIEQEGFRFDTGPSLLNYPWVFEELFRAADRNLHDYVSLLPVDPSVGFLWRDGQTLQLSSDRDFLVSEIARFEADAGRAVDRFFADAREKYRIAFEKLACRNEDNPAEWLRALSIHEALRTGIWRSVWSELSRFFKSRHVREALGSYSMYLGGSPFQLPGLFSILPYGEMEYGLWLPRGGMYSIVEAMERLAIELGVKIHLNSPVSRIEKGGVRLRGIEGYAADVVVSNVDVPWTQTALLGEVAPRLKMTPGVVTFYWGLKQMPEGLRHHTIFLPDDYRGSFDQLMNRGSIPADLPFYISVPSATDPTLAPAGGACMFVLVPVPVLSQLGPLDWEGTVAEIRATVMGRLRQQGVTIPESDIVFESSWTPEDWRERFGLFDGSAFGAAHTLTQVGAFRPSNWSREHPGLYYVGSSTTPGAGVPMVVLSGKMTAERIAAHVR